MKFTDQEAADYLAGRLRLVTSRKSKLSKLIPATRRALDKGVTSPERRAYYRVWYLQNRDKRLAYMRDLKAKNKALGKEVAVSEAAETTEAAETIEAKSKTPVSREARLERMRQWRINNAARIKAYAKARHLKIKAAKAVEAATPTIPVLPTAVVQDARAARAIKLAKKAAYQREWRKKNAAILPELRKRWGKIGKKTAAPIKRTKRTKAERAEARKAYIRQWRIDNPDKVRAAAKARYRRYQAAKGKTVDSLRRGAGFMANPTEPTKTAKPKQSLLKRALGWLYAHA